MTSMQLQINFPFFLLRIQVTPVGQQTMTTTCTGLMKQPHTKIIIGDKEKGEVTGGQINLTTEKYLK